MKIFSPLFLFITLTFFLSFSVNAQEEEACPSYNTGALTGDALVGFINECIEARKKGTPNTIEEFQCPSADFEWETGQKMTDETLAYYISVNLLMNETDKTVKDYMKKLQKSRNKDALAWTENLRKCLHGAGGEDISLQDVYYDICKFGTIQNLLNNNSEKKAIIKTTIAYPQPLCQKVADKKILAWEGLGENLMQDSIQKSFQNDGDTFINKVQGAYAVIIDKFHRYQKIVARATSKVKVYIRNAVK